VNLAILIVLEKYAHPTLEGVAFANRNGGRLRESLEQNGFAAEDCIVLTDQFATKSAIESRVRRAIKSCLEEDVLFVYYAGHNFAWQSKNRLATFDTDLADLDQTTISLSWLHQQFKDSDCKKVVLFLDTGDKELTESPTPIPMEPWDEAELRSFYESSDRCVCFSSCKPGEVSYISRKLQSGIWLNHLVEALDGNAAAALDGTRLTSDKLQAHLSQSVTRTLATTFSTKKRQTPTCYGASGGPMVLLDLEKLLSDRKASKSPFAVLIGDVALWSRRSMSVKNLSGFKKGHSLPDRANHSSQTFVTSLAKDQVTEDLKSVFQALKTAFKLKRADIEVSDQGDGTGTVITPHFNYSVSVQLDPEDPSFVIWSRTIDAIKDPKPLFSAAFASVFQTYFDTVEFALPNAIDIGALIDSIEEADDARIGIEYDPETTYCILSVAGIEGRIRITKRAMRIEYPKAEAPKLLLSSFLAIRTAFLSPEGIDLVAIEEL
jgi:hypothetical protein